MINNLINALSLICMSGTCLLGAGFNHYDVKPLNTITKSFAYSTAWECNVLSEFNFNMQKVTSCQGYWCEFTQTVASDIGNPVLNGPYQFQSSFDIKKIDECENIIDDFLYSIQLTYSNTQAFVITQYNASDNKTYTRIYLPDQVVTNDIDQTIYQVNGNEFCSSFSKPNGVYVIYQYQEYYIKSSGNAAQTPSGELANFTNWYMCYTPQQFQSTFDYTISRDYSSGSYPHWCGFEDYLFVLDNAPYQNSLGQNVSMVSAPLRVRTLNVISTLDNDTWYQYGYNNGYSDGQRSGYTQGYNNGESTGYNNGYDDGVYDGYQDGYRAGLDTAETGDFWTLFGAIADTPVKMIYSLFNFDLFGISMLSLVLTLITGLLVFGIVKRFIK